MIADAAGLLKVVCNDDHGELFGEVAGRCFDLLRCFGIERGTGLVHQQDLRLHSEGAGDAQALLLSSRKGERAVLESVLYFVPQRGPAQTLFYGVGQDVATSNSVDARAVGDVVEDRFRERIGLLEDHSDVPTQGDDIRVEQILAEERDLPFRVRTGVQLVHAVEGAQKRALSTAGRPHDRGHAVERDGQIHIPKRSFLAVVEVQVFCLDDGFRAEVAPDPLPCGTDGLAPLSLQRLVYHFFLLLTFALHVTAPMFRIITMPSKTSAAPN